MKSLFMLLGVMGLSAMTGHYFGLDYAKAAVLGFTAYIVISAGVYNGATEAMDDAASRAAEAQADAQRAQQRADSRPEW